MPLFPYGEQYDAPEKISALLSENTTVILIQNDTILTTGATIHQAFDRLEVADFSALSLIGTMSVGSLVPIGEEEVRTLEEKFL